MKKTKLLKKNEKLIVVNKLNIQKDVANSYNKKVDNDNLYDPKFPLELIARSVLPSHLKLIHILESIINSKKENVETFYLVKYFKNKAIKTFICFNLA